ncbi:augmin complex subunit dgt5 [Drosophila innubila]|uniref:augmin complex subunit dgt5 n=1 Tax=Drosophila innubila TaxID=198719 RepID=UPI00148CABB6|nr:augmin complex subunit dgt5 [Drosophila innubila]
MAFDEQIKSFRTWITSLGCPPSALPTEDALKSIFKSGHSQLFKQLQSRIQPRQVVQEVRENLLIAKVAQIEGKVVPICERSFLPRQLQIHLKMKDLDKKKQNAEQRLVDAKKSVDEEAAAIKTKNIQIVKAKQKNELQRSRINLLKLKLESLNKNYEEELQNKMLIQSTIPVKLSCKNASEKLATQAVKQALKELENFYITCNEDENNPHQLEESKSRLWTEMRQIFVNTPNVMIFNAIMKIKDEQLQHMMMMNKSSLNVDRSNSVELSKFDVKLLKTQADLMGIVANYMCAQNEVKQLEESYVRIYGTFVDELQKKVNNFNGINSEEDEEKSEEIISDFILQYNMRNFYKARNEFFEEQIEKLHLEMETGAKQLENHEMLLASIKQMYNDMNTSINRIQQDVVQLSQIKEKILYSKNVLKNLLDDMHQTNKTHMLSTKLKGNMSLMGMESFCLANDSVLSSTKLDIDANATITGMNNTLVRSYDNATLMNPGATAVGPPSFQVPCHLLELNTFLETSFEKFSFFPRACSFLLLANPLIVDSQELASTVRLVPGHLLTPLGALQEVRKRILWASSIAAHSTDLKLNLEPLIVDPHHLKMKARRQHDKIVQYLDNIEALGVKTQHRLQRAERIYQFILENPLRQYVPPKIKVKNASYADYESEFKLYYRIATAGGSIKS